MFGLHEEKTANKDFIFDFGNKVKHKATKVQIQKHTFDQITVIKKQLQRGKGPESCDSLDALLSGYLSLYHLTHVEEKKS